MQCNSYFQPFIDHLKQPATSAHTPILTFLAAGNRAEANRFVVYMEGELGLSSTFQKVSASPGTTPTGLEVQQLIGICNAYYSDRLAPERAKAISSAQGVQPGSGEISIPPNAVSADTEISIPPNAVPVTTSRPETFQLRHVQRFDVTHFDTLNVSLSLPDGPLTFKAGGNIVSRFSALECRDNGLLVCTSDLDRSILVLSFLAGVRSLEP